MGTQLRLILTTVCIVNFLLSSVRPHSQTDGAHADGTQFLNLNLIVRKGASKNEIYSEILKQEAAKERQIFSVMKDELRIARNRNAYKGIKKNENVVEFKREVDGNKHVRPTRSSTIDLTFAVMYGNNPRESGVWEYLRNIKDDEEKMMNISTQAHIKCFEITPNVTSADFNSMVLFFPSERDLKPIKVDVIMYTVEGRYQYKKNFTLPYYFYLTKGVKAGCVWYLVEHEKFSGKELELLPGDICGLVIP